MLTEEKTAESTPQPELYAAAGRYYIMDRRTKPQDEPQEQESTESSEHEAPVSKTRTGRAKRNTDTGALGYILLGLLGAAAGAATALLYPSENTELFYQQEITFIYALTDRLIHCGIFLVIEYLLGYFAAGTVLVWSVPLMYGLGAGLSAVNAVMAGSPVLLLPFTVYTIVISFAASRSAGFSSLLLSIVSGKSSSILTDGRTSSDYTLKFGIYLMLICAAALLEAGIIAAK